MSSSTTVACRFASFFDGQLVRVRDGWIRSAAHMSLRYSLCGSDGRNLCMHAASSDRPRTMSISTKTLLQCCSPRATRSQLVGMLQPNLVRQPYWRQFAEKCLALRHQECQLPPKQFFRFSQSSLPLFARFKESSVNHLTLEPLGAYR